MAGTSTRPTAQVLNMHNLDAYWGLKSSLILQKLASSTCRCSRRVKQLPTAISVAAPERNYSVSSETQVQCLNQQHKDIRKCSSLTLSEAAVDTQQQQDASSSAPTTSDRPDGQDQPFLPGSRRRLHNRSSRRNLSAANFYGEYCDMKATQRIVSTIWERLMSQNNSSGKSSSGVIDDEVSLSFSSPQPQSDLATSEPHATANGSNTAAELPSLTNIVNEKPTSNGTAACPTSLRAGRTSLTSPLPDGWSVAASAAPAANGDDSTATATIASSNSSLGPLPSASMHPHPSPHMRVVLYLGPEFELELPPPSFGATPVTGPSYSNAAGSDNGNDAGLPWSLSDQELRDSIQGSKPRQVRGCRLSTPEVVQEVSFANTTDPAYSKQARGRSFRNRPDIKASAVGPSPLSSSTPIVNEHGNGGRAMAEGCKRIGKERIGVPPKRSQPGRSLSMRTPAAAAAAVAAVDDGCSSTRHKIPAQTATAATAVETTTTTPTTHNNNNKADVRGSIRSGRSSSSLTESSTTASSRSQTTEGLSALHRPEFSSEPRQAARQRDLLEALVERMSDAVVTERIQKLATVNRSGVTAINFVLQALGEMGHVYALSRLLTLQVALGLDNEHTYGTAFRALHRAGRLGMVLAAFQEACRAGRDLGPVACSVLLHIASVERNLKLAWQLFDEMVAHKMTLNRYSYNCMAHIAALNGALDDVRLIYSMMKAEVIRGGEERVAADGAESTTLREDCRPDSYTYSALVRAAVNAGRGDMLPMMFNEVVATQRAEDRAVGRIRPLMPGEGEGRLSREVWGHFICAAFRTGQSDLALRFFMAGIYELGLLPSREVYNIVLAGLAKTRPLPELLRLYSEMVNGCVRSRPAGGGKGADCGDGDTVAQGRPEPVIGDSGGDVELPPGSVRQPPVAPDHYTFNALLTAAAHHMADLYTVERIRKEMAIHGIGLNTFIGTSLINAYRRTPELSRAAAAVAAARATAVAQGLAATEPPPCDAVAAIDHMAAAAAAVMSELVRSAAANAMSYSCMAAFYAAAQKPAEAADCIRQMTARGLQVEDSVWQFLSVTAEDAGQFGLMRVFEKERSRHMAERHARQQRQQRERAAQGDAGAPPRLPSPRPLPGGLEATSLVGHR